MDPTSKPCRFCGRPADFADRLGRYECVDTAACQRREVAAGLEPHDAIYAKGPVTDPDGPLCGHWAPGWESIALGQPPVCGRRVFDPIHRDGWRAETRIEGDTRLANISGGR